MDTDSCATWNERMTMAMKNLENEVRPIMDEQNQEVQKLKSRLEGKITSLSKGKSAAEEMGLTVLRDALRRLEYEESAGKGARSYFFRKIEEFAQVADGYVSRGERNLQIIREIVETEIEKVINVLQMSELKEKKKKKDKDKKKKKSKKD